MGAGAVWPKGLELDEKPAADNNWWSLQPLSRQGTPDVSPTERARSRSPIDQFVQQRQREKQLTMSAEADRATLIRRLAFDLLGLPPTPEDVAEFVADRDPSAYERLVDRYLASPRLGERRARHWLDVVHYGDTHGYDKDKLRPNAWPYRDYVIRSMNEDKSYDRGGDLALKLAGAVPLAAIAVEEPATVIYTGVIHRGFMNQTGVDQVT